MTHLHNERDDDLHHPDGTHRETPPPVRETYSGHRALGNVVRGSDVETRERTYGNWMDRRESHLRQHDSAEGRLLDSGKWVITATLHGEDCKQCIDCAESAAVHAAVTGSVGSTYRIERAGADGETTVEHQATVKRKTEDGQ